MHTLLSTCTVEVERQPWNMPLEWRYSMPCGSEGREGGREEGGREEGSEGGKGREGERKREKEVEGGREGGKREDVLSSIHSGKNVLMFHSVFPTDLCTSLAMLTGPAWIAVSIQTSMYQALCGWQHMLQ